jgi:hypothetical protein
MLIVSRVSIHRASLILMEEHRWKILKNRLVKRIFGPKRD